MCVCVRIAPKRPADEWSQAMEILLCMEILVVAEEDLRTEILEVCVCVCVLRPDVPQRW